MLGDIFLMDSSLLNLPDGFLVFVFGGMYS